MDDTFDPLADAGVCPPMALHPLPANSFSLPVALCGRDVLLGFLAFESDLAKPDSFLTAGATGGRLPAVLSCF